MIATINLIRSSSAVASDNQAYRLNQPTPPLERHRKMKHLLLTTIAAVLLVGCGESQQSTPSPETQPAERITEVPVQPSSPSPEAEPAELVAEVQPAEPIDKEPISPPSSATEAKPVVPIAEVAQPERPTDKLEAPDISIHEAIKEGDIQAVMQHLAAGADVNYVFGSYWRLQ